MTGAASALGQRPGPTWLTSTVWPSNSTATLSTSSDLSGRTSQTVCDSSESCPWSSRYSAIRSTSEQPIATSASVLSAVHSHRTLRLIPRATSGG